MQLYLGGIWVIPGLILLLGAGLAWKPTMARSLARSRPMNPEQVARQVAEESLERQIREMEQAETRWEARFRSLQGREAAMRDALRACHAFVEVKPSLRDALFLCDGSLQHVGRPNREGLTVISEPGGIRTESYFEEFGSHYDTANHASFAGFLRNYMAKEISHYAWHLTRVKYRNEGTSALEPQHQDAARAMSAALAQNGTARLEEFLASAEMANYERLIAA